MHTVDVLPHWAEVRKNLLAALDKLTDEQLGFEPRQPLWSLGTVACHIADTEEGWLRIAAGTFEGWPPYRIEDYPTVSAVKDLLAAVHERTLALLAGWSDADLDVQVTAPWGHPHTRRWIIWHVLEHEIHHRGEIFLMLGLMGMEAPDV